MSRTEAEEIAALRRELESVSRLLFQANDATFGLAGIFSRVLVAHDLISREALADMIETRAGRTDAEDHNPFLLTFSRAIRMNLPGGRFEVIDGGKNKVDPG